MSRGLAISAVIRVPGTQRLAGSVVGGSESSRQSGLSHSGNGAIRLRRPPYLGHKQPHVHAGFQLTTRVLPLLIGKDPGLSDTSIYTYVLNAIKMRGDLHILLFRVERYFKAIWGLEIKPSKERNLNI